MNFLGLIQENFNFNIDVVLADGIYDTSAILLRISVTLLIVLIPSGLNFQRTGIPTVMPDWKCCREVPSMIKNKIDKDVNPVHGVNGFVLCIILKDINTSILSVRLFILNFLTRKDVTAIFVLMKILEPRLISVCKILL